VKVNKLIGVLENIKECHGNIDVYIETMGDVPYITNDLNLGILSSGAQKIKRIHYCNVIKEFRPHHIETKRVLLIKSY
jgi:hypothetical protein